MRIDPAGFPFIGGALVAAVLAGAGFGWAFGVPFLVLAAFLPLLLSRSRAAGRWQQPMRCCRRRTAACSSPDRRFAAAAPPGEWLQISIFLSPMDVHVNRVPVSGRVTRVSFQRGRFLPAYHHDAAATNERSEIWIDHNGRPIVARQIVGVLARRVVCRLAVGAEVHAGDRYGVMKFGSRMDVFLPVGAELRVKVGDTVRGGETIIAVLH